MYRKVLSFHLLLLIMIASFGPVLKVHACCGEFRSIDIGLQNTSSDESSCCCSVKPDSQATSFTNNCCENFKLPIQVTSYQAASLIKADFSADIYLLLHPAPTFVLQDLEASTSNIPAIPAIRDYGLLKRHKLYKWYQVWKLDC